MTGRRLVKAGARAALSGVFVYSGPQVALNPGPRVQKAADLGLPRPELATRLNGAGMAVAGTAMALGLFPRAAAAALAALLVPTTLGGHAFWREQDQRSRRLQEIQFAKNVGLLGGLLLVALDEEP